MVVNRGRQIQFINGINGVAAGGVAVIQLDVNKRYHRNILQTTAVNYTGGTAKAITKITGTGTAATGTLTIVNGVPTAIAIVAGGSGWTVGDTFTIADATGTGFVGTVATVTGGPPGALTTATVTVAGTPSATDPARVISSLKQIVNGVVMRDLQMVSLVKVLNAQGVYPALGELPLNYTEPTFNVNALNELCSWDMFGQSTFTLQVGISSLVSTPGLAGIMEYDNERNVRPNGSQLVPFLQPVAHHEFTFNIIAGLNKINTIPFDYPIRRIWLYGSTAGQISQFEVYQDGNKVLEATYAQQRQAYEPYGFEFGKPNYLNQTYAGSTTLIGAFNPFSYFDAAYISDPDQRVGKALTCENSLVLRVTSAIAQGLTVVVETLPGQYAS